MYGEELVIFLIHGKDRAGLLARVSCFAKVDVELKALKNLAVIYVDFLSFGFFFFYWYGNWDWKSH